MNFGSSMENEVEFNNIKYGRNVSTHDTFYKD